MKEVLVGFVKEISKRNDLVKAIGAEYAKNADLLERYARSETRRAGLDDWPLRGRDNFRRRIDRVRELSWQSSG
jgi:hypothetical protein